MILLGKELYSQYFDFICVFENSSAGYFLRLRTYFNHKFYKIGG